MLAFLILALNAPGGAPALQGAGEAELPVALAVASPRDTYFLNEPIVLRLEARLDTRFVEEHLVQLFRRRLDVPIQIQADWLDELTGARLLPADDLEAGGAELRSIAVNDDLSVAAQAQVRQIDGRDVTILTLERRLVATSPGPLVVPAATLRFAYADHFEEDAFRGRVPRGREDVSVTSTPLRLTIEPWPAEGQPLEFVDAVGSFTVDAALDRRRLRVGESLKLTLRIEGRGNLAVLTPPRIDFEGFRRLGLVEGEREEGARVLVYDLAPETTAVDAVPPLRFAFLDPGPPARYRTVTTSSFGVAVAPPVVHEPDGPRGPGPADTAGATPDDDSEAPRRPFLLPGLAAAFALAVAALVAVVRRSRGTRAGSARERDQ